MAFIFFSSPMIVVYKLASPSVPFNLWHPIHSAAVCVKRVGRISGRSREDRGARVQKQDQRPAWQWPWKPAPATPWLHGSRTGERSSLLCVWTVRESGSDFELACARIAHASRCARHRCGCTRVDMYVIQTKAASARRHGL